MRRLACGAALASVVLATSANSGWALGPSQLGSTAGCVSFSPVTGSPATLDESQGVTTRGQFWALFFETVPLDVAGQGAKIVLRETGVGALRLYAEGPGGQIVLPAWGPEPHGGSTWTRPGDEWGTGWTLPEAGCWRIHAQRADVAGDLWIDVLPVGAATPPPSSAQPSVRIDRLTADGMTADGKVRHGAKAVFGVSASIANPGTQSAAVSIVIRQGGRVLRLLSMERPTPGATTIDFRHSWRVSVRPGARISARAYVALGAFTDSRVIRLTVGKPSI
jgi:hypothetical protein